MQNKNTTQLTSAEVGTLWTTYMNDSMAACILECFLEKVKDGSIRPIVDYALNVSKSHIKTITGIFGKEGHPIPRGFNEEDYDVDADRLYRDSYYLYYLRNMARMGMEAYGVAMSVSTRQDVLDFFTGCLSTSAELSRRVTSVLLSLGMYIKPPVITVPEQTDFVKKDSFLAGFFGKHRKMTAIEITHVFENLQYNNAGKALLTGFAQVAESGRVKELMGRGAGMAEKHIGIFADKLKEDGIPAPVPWDTFVTSSTDPVFSDKLMLFHTTILVASGIGDYGVAMGTSMRQDMQADYVRLTAEIAQYAADCLKVMIDNGWMEQPPQAVNHEALARQ